MRRLLQRILIGLGTLVVLVAVMQLVPYGRDHTNPPVIREPEWDSPETRAIAVKACFDCHSNETRWPWYASVAPLSWVVQRNVDVGREVINFSEWNRPYQLVEQASQNVLLREMPPWRYRLLHPESRLTDAEAIRLAKGLRRTFNLPGFDQFDQQATR